MIPTENQRSQYRWFSEGRSLIRSRRLTDSSAPGFILTLPEIADSIKDNWATEWGFEDITKLDTQFRARPDKKGWKVMEKKDMPTNGKAPSNGTYEAVSQLVGLALLETTIE